MGRLVNPARQMIQLVHANGVPVAEFNLPGRVQPFIQSQFVFEGQSEHTLPFVTDHNSIRQLGKPRQHCSHELRRTCGLPRTYHLLGRTVDCYHCGKKGIQGEYWRCTLCRGFDLCAGCQEETHRVVPLESKEGKSRLQQAKPTGTGGDWLRFFHRQDKATSSALTSIAFAVSSACSRRVVEGEFGVLREGCAAELTLDQCQQFASSLEAVQAVEVVRAEQVADAAAMSNIMWQPIESSACSSVLLVLELLGRCHGWGPWGSTLEPIGGASRGIRLLLAAGCLSHTSGLGNNWIGLGWRFGSGY